MPDDIEMVQKKPKEREKKETDKAPTVKDEINYTNALEKGKKYLDKYKKAYTATGTRQDELAEAIAFFEGTQYQLASYSDTTPWVVQMKVPHAKNAIEMRCASVSAADYVGELFPITLEDIPTIETLNEMLKDEWQRLDLNTKIKSAILDSAYMREGYIHFTFDGSKSYGGSRDGVIEARMLDSSNIIIDPNAREWDDAQFIAVVGRIPKDVAKRRYGRIVDMIKPRQSGLSDFQKGEISYANDYNIEQDKHFTIVTFYEKEAEGIEKCVLIEDVLVAETLLDGLDTFPIAQMRWSKRKQNCYGISLMDDILTIQKALNSLESATTNIAISSASPAVVIQKGQGLNPKDVAETIGAPQVVYAVNGDPRTAIVPLNTQPISTAVLQIKAQHEEALAKAAGITDQYQGALGTVGNTSSGAKMAIERSKVIEGAIIKNIEEFVEQITGIMVQYIVSQYSGTTVTTVQKNEMDSEYSVKEFTIPEEARGVKYKFYIDLSVRTPYSKELEKQAMMELWQMERQYDSEVKVITVLDVLSKYDVSNKEELAQRFKDATNQSNQNKAEVITKLTGLAQQYGIDPQILQAAMTEIIAGAKETPAVDQFMQMVDQAVAAEQAAAQAQQQAIQGQADQMATQIVDQMDPKLAMQMAQEQSAPNQIAQMMQSQGQMM